MQKVTYDNVLPGFLLLMLAISGNFMASTFGCQLYDKLSNNFVYKNILVFLLMYFSIYFSERYPEHPGVSVAKASILYCFYLIFVKQKPKTMILGLFLLVAAFICEQYKDFVDENSTEETPPQNQTKVLETVQIILATLCVAIAIIGFGIAYSELKAKNKDVTLVNYLFTKCPI